jgi:voltage-gated potassium channel
MSSSRRVLWGIGLLAAIIVAGVTGYMLVERWSFIDSLYMTVITITTAGYLEVHPMSTAGRIFTIILLIGGVGGALYTLTGIIQFILEGDIESIWGKRKMRNRIERMKDHFILCGFGRVGEAIARTFEEENVSFIVIENDLERLAELEKSGYPFIAGDSTREEILKEAGIERARGLVAALGSDADNTYISLTGRQLRPDLFIEARASSEKTENKLKRAGANRIVSPNNIGARRMAMLAIRPAVVDFIDNVATRSGPDLLMENITVSDRCILDGRTVSDFRQYSKANLLAINRRDGSLLADLSGDEKISTGDSLIIIGTTEQLSFLEGICEGEKKNE